MPAGTITLTNNSTAVTGSGTALNTELKPNDFLVAVVGGVTYTLGVKSVESATALTLITAYSGPTTSGLAWTPIPNGTLVGITAQIAADTARAIRGLNYDKQNWQQVYSSSGNITVMLPDGSTWSGPSWKHLSDTMATKINGVVPVEQGGTGAPTAKGARDHLEIPYDTTSYTIDAEFPLNIAIQGVFDYRPNASHALIERTPLGVIGGINVGKNMPGTGIPDDTVAGVLTHRGWVNNSGREACFQLTFSNMYQGFRPAYSRSGDDYWYNDWIKIYTAKNTAVDTNGFIKAASPIVKLFADGTAETNEESDGCIVTRLGVGEYKIEGCMGLNADAAWGGIDGGFDIPKDRNHQALVWLDYDVNPDGSILVKTYHRTYPDAPVFARNIRDGYENGDPIDIPADQFVSVRVEMPQNSIWNQKQAAAQKAMEEAERERQLKAEQEATQPDA